MNSIINAKGVEKSGEHTDNSSINTNQCYFQNKLQIGSSAKSAIVLLLENVEYIENKSIFEQL